MDLVKIMKMKFKLKLSSPLMQVISFSLLLVGNNEFGGPLFVWLLLNILGDIYFSIFGFICILIPFSTYFFKLRFNNFTQLLTIFLMLLFVFFYGPGKYFYLYVLHNKLSIMDIFLCISSFLFFVIVNVSVLVKLIRFQLNKSKAINFEN